MMPAQHRSEVQEISEPGSNRVQTVRRHVTRDSGEPVTRERPRLFGHDPGWLFETAGPADADMVRPAAIRCRDRQHDDERRDGVEIPGRSDDEHRGMPTLLATAHRFERSPRDDSRSKIGFGHE